jgi:hypothetical protein
VKNTIKLAILFTLTGALLACDAMLPRLAATTEPGSAVTTSAPSTNASSVPAPSGKPSAEWEGIPVMPGAVAAENDAKGYTYSVKASVDDVKNFYVQQLGQQGWQLLGGGQATTNSLIMIFTKGSDTVTVSAIPQSDGTLYVFLAK